MTMQLVGGTGRDDPWRVPFPTYRMVSADHAAGTAVVEIGEADLPDHPHFLASAWGLDGDGRVLPPKIMPLHYEAWYAHLDERYREHSGRFRPVVV